MSVFLAWVPDGDALDTIGRIDRVARDAFADDMANHRWRRRDQWHMTLRHLGEGLAPGMQPRLEAHMARIACAVPPHHAEPVALDAWRGAKVLVLRISLPPALAGLFARIETAMRACGLRAEDRPVRPHLTLAYLDGQRWPDATALPALPDGLPPFAIGRIRLLENPGTGRYRPLAEWALRGATPAADASHA